MGTKLGVVPTGAEMLWFHRKGENFANGVVLIHHILDEC
jgi:hypothetical protein